MATNDPGVLDYYLRLLGQNNAQMALTREQQQAYQEYLYATLEYQRERMRLLEIPEMQLTDERQRHQIALQYVSEIATQSGWMIDLNHLDYLYNPDNKREAPDLPSNAELLEGAIPTMEMINYMGNPRNFAQSFGAAGYTPEQTGNILRQSPLVQNLAGYPGVSFTGNTAQNPNFNFVTGNQIQNPQEVGRWIQSGDTRVPIIESFASYSGQDQEGLWKGFLYYSHPGQQVTAPRYA